VYLFSFAGADWPLALGGHRVAFPPLPVVVTVVVNFLDRDCRSRQDIIWKIIGRFVDFVLPYLFLKTDSASFAFCKFLCVVRGVLELDRSIAVKCVDDVCR